MLNLKCESVSRCFQPEESLSGGLLRDCENIPSALWPPVSGVWRVLANFSKWFFDTLVPVDLLVLAAEPIPQSDQTRPGQFSHFAANPTVNI